MNSLSFLIIAIVISIVGSIIWVLRNRTPTSPYMSIDKFTDRMSALDPSSPSGFSVIDRPLDRSKSGSGSKPDDVSESSEETSSQGAPIEPDEDSIDG